MELNVVLKYILAIVSALLVVAVLLQQRGSSLGSVFGGAGGEGLYRSKRGFEAFLYNATIVLGILFAILALSLAIVNV